MTIAYSTLAFYIFITYAFTGAAKFMQPGYNNNAPREFLETVTGKAKRAHWAHLNSLEAMPQFFAAVIIAHLVELPQSHIDIAAIAFCVLRLFYGLCYIADYASGRSICWALAMLCNLYLITGAFWNIV